MKSRNFIFPRALAFLPHLDAFQPENADDATGGGTLVSPFDSVDFKIVPGGVNRLAPEINYTELHLNTATGGSNPIKDQENPERAILAMPLPEVGVDWTMTLKLEGPEGLNEVQISRVGEKFDVLRLSHLDQIIHIAEEEFFTIQLGIKDYVTYVNINQLNEVVKLNHSSAEVFAMFSVSFLGRSNG